MSTHELVGAATDETELLRRLSAVPTANIGDGMDRLGLMDSAISPVWPGAAVAGTAFTCWTRPGDNLWIHKAVDEAAPGDVIVVAGGGDVNRALIGELLAARAKAGGIAGFVIDGAVRDAQGLEEYRMPVFARALTPAGPYKDGPGKLGTPVSAGGVAVLPGDVVVGDADGVVVVPRADLAQVVVAAEAVQQRERLRRQDLDAAIAEAQSAGSLR